jgi:hypothetical protein
LLQDECWHIDREQHHRIDRGVLGQDDLMRTDR